MPQIERVAVAAKNGAGKIQSTKNEPFSTNEGGQTPVVYFESRTYPLSIVRKNNRFRRMYHNKPQGKSCA
jgi:hypothetical protein